MATRVLIYSGKGGTGKTTVSAATAALLASQGKRVLIMSSDPAHSLSDVIGQPISRDEMTLLAPNLYGLEIDTIYEMRKNMGGFQKYMANAYTGRGVESSVAAELSNQPGMDEILSLNRLMSEYQSGKWDCIIVDTAPTGNTLRLLAYPEMIIGGESGKKFFKVYRGFSNVVRPLRQSGPDDSFFKEINTLMEVMNNLSRFIISDDVTVRLVLNPEKLPLMETKRAYTFLSLYGIKMDACMVNKVLPAGKRLGAYFDYWVQLQTKYIKEIEESFQPMPIFKSVLEDEEPIGIMKLIKLAARLYGDYDPMAQLYSQQLMWVEDIKQTALVKSKLNAVPLETHRRLCIQLPFVEDQEDLLINCVGSDIQVTAGRLQRSINLPRILLESELSSYCYEKGILKLEFVEKPPVAAVAIWEDDPFFVGSNLN